MRSPHFTSRAAVVAVVVIAVVGTVSSPLRLEAQDGDALRIQQGFAIAPVPLNLAGKDYNLVGLGL